MSIRGARSRLAPLALALLFCGCVPSRTTSERIGAEMAQSGAEHSNARWQSEGAPFHYPTSGGVYLADRTLLGTPAPTSANDALQAEAIAKIGHAEQSMKGRSAQVKIREVRSWPGEGAGVREIWVLADPPAPRMVAYVLTFTPTPAGTEIGLKGPFQ